MFVTAPRLSYLLQALLGAFCQLVQFVNRLKRVVLAPHKVPEAGSSPHPRPQATPVATSSVMGSSHTGRRCLTAT
jgi:hypothetical protein